MFSVAEDVWQIFDQCKIRATEMQYELHFVCVESFLFSEKLETSKLIFCWFFVDFFLYLFTQSPANYKETQTKMRKLYLFYLIVILCSFVYGQNGEEEEEEEGEEVEEGEEGEAEEESENKEPVLIKIGEIVSNKFAWI